MSQYDEAFDEWWKRQNGNEFPATSNEIARAAYIAGMVEAGTYSISREFTKIRFGNGRFVKIGESGILIVGWEA